MTLKLNLTLNMSEVYQGWKVLTKTFEKLIVIFCDCLADKLGYKVKMDWQTVLCRFDWILL